MSASVRDVAASARVSIGTVSNVLNHPEKVSPAVLANVHNAIRELGFIRNGAARQLRAGRSRTIGLIVLDVRNPFFTDLARGAEDRAAVSGLSIFLGNTDEDAERESTYLDLFEEQRALGVLISPYGPILDRLEILRARGISAVLVDRSAEGSSFSSVSVDDVAGGRLAVRHLIAEGNRRIAFVGGTGRITQVSDRLAGARAAVAEESGAILEVIQTSALGVADGQQAARGLLERAPADRPDAIFAANDLIALGVLQTLVVSGVRVPQDVAIIGYDDIDFASFAIVPLSSVRQPSMLIGGTSVDLLMEEVENPDLPPRQIVFQPELVARASTHRLQ